MTPREELYSVTATAVYLAEQGLLGKSLLLNELRSIRNRLEPSIKDTFREEVRKKAESLAEKTLSSS